MRVAQKFAGYSLAEADNLRKAMGKKSREVMAKERDGVRGRLRDAPATAATLGKQLFDIIEKFADYAFNKSHTLRLRPGHLPDRLPQGALPGRVLRLPAHERQEQPRQGRRLPRRLPVDGHQGAHARHQPLGDRLRRARRRDERARRRRRCRSAAPARSRSGCRRCATSARGSSSSCSPSATRTARSTVVPRLRRAGARAGAQQAHRRVADQGRRVRHARAHPHAACSMVFEQIIDTTLDAPPRARPGRDEPVRRLGRRRRRRRRRRSTSASPIPDIEFDKSDQLKFEKEMLGLYVSDHPLLGVEAALRRKVDHVGRRPRRAWTTARMVDARRRHHRPGPQVHQEGRPDGRLRARGPRRRRSRSRVFPRTLHGAGPQARRRPRSSPSRAASTGVTSRGSASSARTSTVLDGPRPTARRRRCGCGCRRRRSTS